MGVFKTIRKESYSLVFLILNSISFCSQITYRKPFPKEMNKEKNQVGKLSIQIRGRWSVRLNNELLDLVQKGIDSWESIASKLGFSVNVSFQVIRNH